MAEDIKLLVASIVQAYTTTHKVDDLPGLIKTVHDTFLGLNQVASPAGVGSQAESSPSEAGQTPAVPPARSVFQEYIVCLEDGKKHRMLKRHLHSAHGMTPEAYRKKWNLPPTYPMVAPTYAKERSRLARDMGLGSTIDKTPSNPHPAATKAVRSKPAETLA